MRLTPLVGALIATIALPSAVSAEVVTSKKLAAMSPADFHARSVVDADPLEFHTTISTERAFRDKAAAGTVWSDAHLRAVVDRQTGATRYEVRKAIRYFGPRRDFQTAHYAAGSELRRAALTIAEHGANVCPNSDYSAECQMTKTLAFPIDESVLREVAASYRPGDRRGWGFKLKDVAGNDVDGAIAPAEAAGLLQAVGDYRAKLGTKVASASASSL